MIRAATVLLLLTTPAAAQAKPTAVLFDGALQYQPAPLRPLASIGNALEQQGWRVVSDTHLGLLSDDEEPVLLIGHSAGGARALAFAKRQVEQVKYQPAVILLDAAPHWTGVWRCHVKRCVAFRTAGYPKIPGAQDYPVKIGPLEHVRIATDDRVKSMILALCARLVRR